jgi:hypothetical protein
MSPGDGTHRNVEHAIADFLQVSGCIKVPRPGETDSSSTREGVIDLAD